MGGMMRKIIKGLLSLNLAVIIRGMRFGFNEFRLACLGNYLASAPFEGRDRVATKKELGAIPQVDLRAILADSEPTLKLTLSYHEDGMLPLDQAVVLASILVSVNPKEVLEIGTFMGHTTKLMAENQVNSVIHTVDLPTTFIEGQDQDKGMPKDDFHLIKRRVVGREFRGQPCEKRIVQHFVDSAEWDFREAGRPTFFFIDGSHTYEYCRHDSEKCFELCDGKGVFLWHDCDEMHPGVIKFLTEWRAMGRNIVRIPGTTLAYWKSS